MKESRLLKVLHTVNMALTTDARTSSCSNSIPKCFSEALNTTIRRRANFSTSLCVNGTEISKIFYHYDFCEREYIGQLQTSSTLDCHCIVDAIEDCRPYMNLQDKCNTVFISLLSVQFIVTLVGVTLNSIIIVQFLRRSFARKRTVSILLLNQAIADMVNCLVYLTPLIVTHFHNVTNREYHPLLDSFSGSTAFLSIASSLFIFLIIAFERYLSIVKPFWHRVHLRKTRIWRSIITIWLIAVTFAIIAFCLYLKSYNGEADMLISYTNALQVISGLLITTVTVLFTLTFSKALVSIRRNDLSGAVLTRKKKEFTLTATFTVMYVSFLICFIPLVFLDAAEKSPKNRLKILCFSFTSIINPILTLKLRREFRVGNKYNEKRASVISNASVISARVSVASIASHNGSAESQL